VGAEVLPALRLEPGEREVGADARKASALKVFITGQLGYLGSVLTRKALDRGYSVVGLDAGYYSTPLVEAHVRGCETIRADVCDVTAEMLEGCDFCLHLAALSNDGSCDISEDETHRVNVEGTRKIAKACSIARIPMGFSSSASVYGSVWFDLSREDSHPNPVSAYARSKVTAEGVLQHAALSCGLRCIIFRQSTLFGWSPRMRYDLVVNALLKSALTTGDLVAQGGGETWRPLLYVGDCANVWLSMMESRTDRWWSAQHGAPVFNVAHHEEGVTKPYRISELVWWMHLLLRDRGIETRMVRDTMESPDLRDYAIDAARLQLAGFVCSTGITSALDEMLEHIRAGECVDFDSDIYYNARVQQAIQEGRWPPRTK